MQAKSMALNLAHLLFLHGIINTMYQEKHQEQQLSEFLHDLLILFELYIESTNMDSDLLEKFNYSPLKTKNHEDTQLQIEKRN